MGNGSNRIMSNSSYSSYRIVVIMLINNNRRLVTLADRAVDERYSAMCLVLSFACSSPVGCMLFGVSNNNYYYSAMCCIRFFFKLGSRLPFACLPLVGGCSSPV